MQQKKTDWNNLFLFLSLGILFYLYLTYSNIQQTPSQSVLAKDSISVNENTKQEEQVITQTDDIKQSVSLIDTSEQNETIYTINNEVFSLNFSNRGGIISKVRLNNYVTYDSLPIIFMGSKNSNWSFSYDFEDIKIKNNDILFNTDINELTNIKGKEKKTFSFEKSVGDKLISHEYTVYGNSHYIDYNLYIDGNLESDIGFKWDMKLKQFEKSISTERNLTTAYYKLKKDDEVDYLSEMSSDLEDDFGDKLSWIAYKQQFFASTFINDAGFKSAELEIKVPEDDDAPYLKEIKSKADIDVDTDKSKHQFPFKLYFGPVEHAILSESGNDLENIIPLGWPIFRAVTIYFIAPTFSFLEKYIGNYGIIILLLSVLIKLIVSPLTYKTYISQIKMRVIKPETDALKEKYKDDNQKFSGAQMELYRKAGVNPLSGCLPMLLQMPILFAMFRFFPSSIQLRQQGFLWADDLSSYDSILDLPFDIPFYGAHVSLFTILMTITSVFYSRMNSNMMDTGNSQMAKQMQMMQYFLPIMFLGIFNNFSSALSYYYFLFNILSFGQQFILKKFVIDETKIHQEIKDRQSRPAKKSKFQQKLDKYMKDKGQKK
ncbi:MAG TPA: membrane protein insertase YidC [Bacteroidetes bacterium]|nr:membrane protein insertase YidC [Bacteroidota bacterium]